ncbi:hypothetical protein RJ55_02033 [Drechmeria coniospora]|nr:hypothetical protein RJ55_02033 [Drechmeria coniospora]
MHASTFLALFPLSLALAAPQRRWVPAPLIVPRSAELVESKYIVKMYSDAKRSAVASAVSKIQADADFTYSRGFKGFAATLQPEELRKLRLNPSVDFIEHDAIISINSNTQQEDATWGLSRISSQQPGGTTYSYDESAGEGTCAYIIDTGVNAKDPDFEGRATFLKNFVEDDDDTDGNGHGTHVAGTIGSKTWGVAKKTKIFGVKVLDAYGSGRTSGVLAGMDFVTKDAVNQTCPKGAVVNMSLGGYKSKLVNDAAAAITNAGLFLAVAAGNDGADAANYSPASEPSACTVGATSKDDKLAKYSNWGKVVDVLAPGSNITSLWINGRSNRTISGTSMASPHVAGIAAYFMGMGQPIAGLCDYIAKNALSGAISNVPNGTVNALINNGFKLE